MLISWIRRACAPRGIFLAGMALITLSVSAMVVPSEMDPRVAAALSAQKRLGAAMGGLGSPDGYQLMQKSVSSPHRT